ncbi:uncharacterized protein LDX57_006982 [Aspergillus melleus]|uniref:uncharacterized protein n=1 Tax=Aspergillus melleus TaxID=138277 RepID=UPI001E8DC55D|nr:uncharacterized protein LDX57_006982 [Aspergillus melleus]KAH8429315.1 hypothetical protein LDX57_006982 [Aspergillus melleus]
MSYFSPINGSRQPVFLIVTGVLLLLSCISVALRWYCRAFHVLKLGADDHLIALALAVTVAMGIMSVFNVSFGTGRHVNDLPLHEILVPTLKHWYAFQIVYPVAIGLANFSILAQYHRIFVKPNFRHVVVGVAKFVLIYTIIVVFVNVISQAVRKEATRD